MGNNVAKGFGMGLAIGALAGLVLGILYAPRAGRETRAMLRERAGGVIEKVRERADTVAERVKGTAAHIKAGVKGE